MSRYLQSTNAPTGRVYVMQILGKKHPRFSPPEGHVWVRYGGRWRTINWEWLHQMLYPDMWVNRASMRTRIFDQQDRIKWENEERMCELGITQEDLEIIRGQ